MFGLGFWEIAIILGVALLVLGPSKLPELARGLGKGLREFRKATEDFKSTIEDEAYRPDPVKPRPEVKPPETATVIAPETETKPAELPPPPMIASTDPLKQAGEVAEGANPKSPTET